MKYVVLSLGAVACFTTYPAHGRSAGPPTIKYASRLCAPAPGGLAPGASTQGDADCSATFNRALAGGNVWLVLDGAYALSAALKLDSQTKLYCLNPQQDGLIMLPGSNSEMLLNAHPNAPTTPSGTTIPGTTIPTGNMLVGNQQDSDLWVDNCGLNFNADAAVTGADMVQKVAHKVNPSTGRWVNGVRFIGVHGATFTGNVTYNSATYSFNISNASNVVFRDNFIRQPLPLVVDRNTDALHFDGPVDGVFLRDNRLVAGDDCMAFNADDGQELRLGDPNYRFVDYPAEVGGPITRVAAENNQFEDCATGVRLLSVTEDIDYIAIRDTTGRVRGTAFAAGRFYDPSSGPGNIGHITVDGWAVAPDAVTYAGYNAQQTNFFLDGAIDSLSLADFSMINPQQNWPIVRGECAEYEYKTTCYFEYNCRQSSRNIPSMPLRPSWKYYKFSNCRPLIGESR